MSRKYPKVQNGEKVAPQMQGYKMACCDCGLVHVLDFEVVRVTQQKAGGYFSHATPRNADKLRVVFSARRDNRATAALRRKKP